jgi:hypothetical protein
MYITLDQIKRQLNIDSAYSDDDEYLTELIDVCEGAVQLHINDNLQTIADANSGVLPSELAHAMKLLVGHFYNHREIVTAFKASELTKSYDYLLAFFIHY